MKKLKELLRQIQGLADQDTHLDLSLGEIDEKIKL